jgi:hypothetical protein
MSPFDPFLLLAKRLLQTKADVANATTIAQSAQMKTLRLTCLLLGPLLSPMAAHTKPTGRAVRVGDTYEITKTRDSASKGSDASSGSSHDQDTLIERIQAVTSDGLEAVFDLPQQATQEERQQTWQFPARVFERHNGQLQLLNAPELEKRADAWLKWAKMTREACGHWIFTWNAFKIECDPQSVIETVQEFDPRLPDLRAGTSYQDAHALLPAPLRTKTTSSEGSTFTATMAIDPTAVQRDRARADVVIGEIMRKPVTLDAALVERAKEAVSGTIEVTIEADAGGNLRRLTKVTKSQTRKPDGTVQTETVTETIERRRLSSTNT